MTPRIDPISLIYTNVLVSLVVTAVLWVSRVGLRNASHGVRTWIVAEIALAASRTVAVVDLSGTQPVDPFGLLVIPGMLAMLGLILHLEALRRMAGAPATAPVLAAQVLGLMLLFGVPAATLWAPDGRLLWLNALMALMAVVTLRWLWPMRRIWGARVMAAMMLMAVGFFGLRLLALALGVESVQPDPGLKRLGVIPVLFDMLISLFMTTGFLLLLQERLRERIERLVVTDALTGSLNRHGLMPLLEREVARVARHQHPLSVALFDLDHFKRVNDQHGHAVGDRVLAGFAERVHGMLRTGDLFGRWGGEEFLLVLPETPGDAARQVAERIRAGVADTPLGDGVPAVTVSGGVASAAEIGARAQDLLRLLDLADKRLYQAKTTRNAIVAG